MAFFGRQRDINLFTTVNRELLGDIITQECAFYKYRLDQTTINIYGESAEDKYYDGPTLFNCIIERQNQTNPIDEMGVPDFEWPITFKFLREDLQDANVVPEVGDIVMWHEDYYEVDTVRENQLFLGKDNSYNLTDYGSQFGASVSIIVDTHMTRRERTGIEYENI